MIVSNSEEQMQQSPELRYSILLAEDDPDDQKIIRDALAAAIPDARLTIVENGKEAVSYLECAYRLPDLFITDIQMPLMTGLEALACIKNSISYLPAFYPWLFYQLWKR